jgi:microcin C transport system substrate-binding protein
MKAALLNRAGVLCALFAATAAPAPAQTDGDTIVSHGISTFGDLKYPADFDHLDYVNPDAPKGGEMSLSWQGTFDSMNPYTAKGRAGYLASIFFEDMMVAPADEIGSLYCLLCETIEYPESREWVIFNLRPEVTFSDGTPMTAEDVLFTYEILRDEGLPSFRAVLPQTIAAAEVLDEHTIRFDFTEGSPPRDRIQLSGSLPVFSKAWFEANDAGLDESRLEPAVGTGPYVLDRYDINQRIVYRRNPDYWGADLPINAGRNNFDTIRVEYFGDANAAFEGFKAGAYLWRQENSSKTWATGYDFPGVNDGTVVKTELPDGTIAPGQSFAINLRRDEFQDPRVREALQLMFNFEWSNETLFYGLYDRIHSFWENTDLAAEGAPTEAELEILRPLVEEGLLDESILTEPAVMAPESDPGRQLDRGNLRRASRLLDEAGWEVGDDGMRRKDGRALGVEIIEDSPTFDRVINPYVQNLRALGIDARYSRIDPAQFTDRTRGHDFDMFTDQFPMAYEPGGGLKQYFASEGVDDVFNSAGVSDPAVDRLIDVVMRADTQEALTPAVRALDRVLRAKRFWVPQWYNDAYFVAYYDIYEHPEPLPPYALGVLDFWWVDQEALAALESKGAL